MVKMNRGPPHKVLWAYAYDITLPDNDEHFRKIQDLLDEEHSEAEDGDRTWAGRVVAERRVTRVLVVSDGPAQDREVNRRLEAELKQLEATFEMTVPLAVVKDGPGPHERPPLKKPTSDGQAP